MNEINAQALAAMISAIHQRIADNVALLNQLDSALGDGDHGTGISTAFGAAVEQVENLENPQPVDILKATALALMNRMGGASGALFGSFFLKGALTVQGKATLTKADMDAMLDAGLAGVKHRGKSDVGDKTMIDALAPAVEAFRAKNDFASGWQAAAQAAEQGAEATKALVAKHGRAKFAGERAVGHQDAGATSIALMFAALHDYDEE